MHRRFARIAIALAAAATPAAASPATPVPGTVGLVGHEVALRHACAPSFAQITVRKRGDDPVLVKALTWPRIGGLDFDPAHQRAAAASLKRFDTWYRALSAAFQAALDGQRRVAGDPSATPTARVEAMARTALLSDQMAVVIGSLDVPKNIRAYPEAVTVFCDTLDDKAAPLEASAAEARAACAKHIAGAQLPDGWWTAVCAPPAP